ncbi:MAG: twin-arginine translocase TatA/TatE family subunit [Microthrixaceae bacterium]
MALAPIASSNPLALIDSLGGGELLAILVMLMVVVGPDRLPEVARKIGRGIAQARQQIASMSTEVRDVVDDPAMQPLREIGEFAMRPRQKLSEIVKLAELDLTEETAAKQAEADRAAAAAEPGEPPRDGPQQPPNIDDKLGDRPPRPEDVHLAASRQARETQAAAAPAVTDAEPEPAGSEDQPPLGAADPAFTTRGAPLDTARIERPDPTESSAGSPNDTTHGDTPPGDTPPGASTPTGAAKHSAFTAGGRPLGTPDQADTHS